MSHQCLNLIFFTSRIINKIFKLTLRNFVSHTHTTDTHTQKKRWAAKMDSARLLSVMFGSTSMRKAFVQSKQPLSKDEMDGRVTLNRFEQYWTDVATVFSNPDADVHLHVDNCVVLSYLQENLNASHRRSVSAGECQKQYENLRAQYEGSKSWQNYRRSGQGEPNFFPDFCNDNPIHVYLHYIMRDDEEHTGNDNLSLAAFSLINESKHVNTMPMPSTRTIRRTPTYGDDEDVPSSSDQPKRSPTATSFLRRLSKSLDQVMKDVTPAKRKREVDTADIIARKLRLKKLRRQLKEMNEVEPDDDFERDDHILKSELSTVNDKLASLSRGKVTSAVSATTVNSDDQAPSRTSEVSAITVDDSDENVETGASAVNATTTGDEDEHVETGASAASATTTGDTDEHVETGASAASATTPGDTDEQTATGDSDDGLLKSPIWLATLPKEKFEDLQRMVNRIQPNKFKENSGHDEGFENEPAYEITSYTQKKVNF